MNNKQILSIKDKQEASLEILLHFHDFCLKHNITYFLAYGTLIGAVRHKGFIPWDDDIDVHMPRPDYERFLQYFNDPKGTFRLFTCFNDKKYVLPYAKVQNMKTARVLQNGKVVEEGIGIDLFPLDAVPADLDYAERTFKNQNDKFMKIVQRYDRLRYIKPSTLKDLAKMIVGKLIYTSGYLQRVGQSISLDMYGCDYNSCKRVAAVVGIHSGIFRVFEKEWFEPIDMEFEGRQLKGPKGYDNILNMIYGDYMTVPPEDKRISTHQEVFIWR